jgi:hypothetical protein
MKVFRKLLVSAFLCIIFSGLYANASAQRVTVLIETLKCDEGKIIHPVHVDVSIFDADNISEIMKVVKNLRSTLDQVNSDPNAIQKAEIIFSQLQKLVATTPSLARLRNLPTPEYRFQIPLVKRIVVFAFEKSEFDSFAYAMKELDISSKNTNNATLNFSSEVECKGAK